MRVVCVSPVTSLARGALVLVEDPEANFPFWKEVERVETAVGGNVVWLKLVDEPSEPFHVDAQVLTR